ncbi:MAG: cytidylate kinase-like family protein [Clostridia bacterium]|nr:cytidylate kinase-like family protein [Clostridia bacterium]
MKIITISRKFGSGGRELGKRLADALGIPCYDHEILEAVAERHGFDQDHVAHVSEKEIRVFYPTSIAHLLIAPHPMVHQSVKIAVAEHEIIKEIASAGGVIVGRCSDVILRDMHPMNLFVYADTASKLERCKSKADETEHFSDKELLKKMKEVDKERAAYRAMFTECDWGRKESYHLCINTSGKEIKTLIPGIAEYVKLWFSEN